MLSGGRSSTRKSLQLEFVPQCELHHARVGQEPGVISKGRTKAIDRAVDAERIEASGVEYVEDLPTELKALAFPPRHVPPFGETHI